MLQSGTDPGAIEAAAARLAAGELLAFPTETVYGLGARADDDAAVAQIFALKGRPAGHPLIVHLAEAADADIFAPPLPPVASRLVAAFWPGPLTVIVPRRPGIAAAAAGGQDSIGLRCPAHPVARALLRAARARGVPGVAAPSANRFGKLSPTLAAHVVAAFGPSLAVLDGGACEVGIESTIVDCSRGRAVLLRPGLLSRAAIEAGAGEPVWHADEGRRVSSDDDERRVSSSDDSNGMSSADDGSRVPGADGGERVSSGDTGAAAGMRPAPRAPGTLAAHYAPRARLRLLATAQLHTALQAPGDLPPGLALYSRAQAPVGAGSRLLLHRRMPADPVAAAHELFAALHRFDAAGAREVWVEQPPPGPEWEGVRDRLQRAAAGGAAEAGDADAAATGTPP